MSRNPCSFHLSHYQDTLHRWSNAGYHLTSFKDFRKHENNSRILILRHDLDFRRCISSAVKMAAIEQSCGASASYFVRLHGEEYNPMEYSTYLSLKRIKQLGHEIGFHFECHELAEVANEKELDVFLKGKTILETLLDTDIVSACEHGDYHRFESTAFKRFFERFDQKSLGIQFDPYDPLYFSEMKYLSDSNQNWRDGCFCKHVGNFEKVQVATHPGFWYEKHYAIG